MAGSPHPALIIAGILSLVVLGAWLGGAAGAGFAAFLSAGALAVFAVRSRPDRTIQVARSGAGRCRLLVLLATPLRSPAILAVEAAGCEVHVVVPAESREWPRWLTAEDDKARKRARRRLDDTLSALREHGVEASGRIGFPEPQAALEEALREFGATEVLVAGLDPALRDRLAERLPIPLRELETPAGAIG